LWRPAPPNPVTKHQIRSTSDTIRFTILQEQKQRNNLMTVSSSYSFAVIKRRAVLTLFLLWISGAPNYSSAIFAAGFVPSPTITSVAPELRYPILLYTTHHFVPATSHFEKRGHIISNLMHTQVSRKYKATPSTSTAIRGASIDNDDEDEELADYGDRVSGIFGNLRIPASLIAGASLASAFEVPLAVTDGLKLGIVKRLYSLVMMGTLSSMLLTVLISTMCMNDIAMSPPRRAKYVKDYIEQNYALEWMLTKTHFMWGNVVFVLGSMMRGWMFLKCPIIADGVLGVMGSLTLVSISILVEFTENQTGQTSMQQMRRSMDLVLDKMKTNRLFRVAAVTWMATAIYMIAKIPYIYLQLTSP
jgi:hypothetical protein